VSRTPPPVNRKQTTWHVPDRRRVIGAAEMETDLRVNFMQPLPGHPLLMAARARTRQANAEAWTSDGDPEVRGCLGDAVEDVLTTASGKVWVSHFRRGGGQKRPGDRQFQTSNRRRRSPRSRSPSVLMTSTILSSRPQRETSRRDRPDVTAPGPPTLPGPNDRPTARESHTPTHETPRPNGLGVRVDLMWRY
jgi:hypothetical protein